MAAGTILGIAALARGIQQQRQKSKANQPLDPNDFYQRSLLARNQLQESLGFQPQGPTVPGQGPGLSTRQPAGLSGDAALDQTARFFQKQMSRQLGTEIGNINTNFSNIGRFTSGQRGEQIEGAQERAGQGFSDFLSRTALERYLQEQRLQTQSDIAMAQIEAGQGSSRTQLFGNILQSGANIFASNPQGTTDFFRNLFTRSGGKVPTGDPFRFFNPNTSDIQLS